VRLEEGGDDDAGPDEYDPNADPGADNDDDFVPLPRQKKGSARPGGPGKVKGSASGKSKEEKEIKMRDERKKPAAAVLPASSTQPTSAKRSRSSDEDPVVPSSPLTPDPAVKPPPMKKPKLPTIKKNKLPPTTTTATTASGSAGPSTPASGKLGGASGLSGQGTPSSVPRKPAATVGNADFDLRNANVYKDLFKTVSALLSTFSPLTVAESVSNRWEIVRLLASIAPTRTRKGKSSIACVTQRVLRDLLYVSRSHGLNTD
jgi:hypothetical protein